MRHSRTLNPSLHMEDSWEATGLFGYSPPEDQTPPPPPPRAAFADASTSPLASPKLITTCHSAPCKSAETLGLETETLTDQQVGGERASGTSIGQKCPGGHPIDDDVFAPPPHETAFHSPSVSADSLPFEVSSHPMPARLQRSPGSTSMPSRRQLEDSLERIESRIKMEQTARRAAEDALAALQRTGSLPALKPSLPVVRASQEGVLASVLSVGTPHMLDLKGLLSQIEQAKKAVVILEQTVKQALAQQQQQQQQQPQTSFKDRVVPLPLVATDNLQDTTPLEMQQVPSESCCPDALLATQLHTRSGPLADTDEDVLRTNPQENASTRPSRVVSSAARSSSRTGRAAAPLTKRSGAQVKNHGSPLLDASVRPKSPPQTKKGGMVLEIPPWQ